MKGAGKVDWQCRNAWATPVLRTTSTVSRISPSVDIPVETTIGMPVRAMCVSRAWLVRSAEATLSAGTPYAASLGERATLLQLSSAFCAPCRATRQVLEQVTSQVDGVAHVEVDAEQHLDLVRRLKVMRTPTTLVLDATGAEVGRAGGVPTRQQVGAALAQAGLE